MNETLLVFLYALLTEMVRAIGPERVRTLLAEPAGGEEA